MSRNKKTHPLVYSDESSDEGKLMNYTKIGKYSY